MGLFFVKSYSFAHNCKEVAFWSLLENFHMVSTLISNNHLTVLHCDSQVRSCLATVSSYNKSKDEWIFRCESDITVATDWYAAIPHKKLDNAIKVPAKLYNVQFTTEHKVPVLKFKINFSKYPD